MISANPRISLRQPDGSTRVSSSLSELLGAGPWLVVSPHDDDIVLRLGLTSALAHAQAIQVHVAVGETAMACVWASSRIWLELGEPMAAPSLWEYTVYCPFESAPELEVMAGDAMLERKLRALAAFESQGVIDDMVARLRADGPY